MKDRMGQALSFWEILKKIVNRLYNIYLDLVLFKLNLISYLIPFHSLRNLAYRIAGVRIGEDSYLHMGVRFYYPAGIKIGRGTIIGDRCFLDGRASLKIGNHVDIASQVLIYNSQHDIDSEGFNPIEEPVEIGDYVFIGPRAIILPGVTVGKGAVIAAGAVVTHDVGQFDIVGGVPAKVIGQRQIKDPHYKLGRARLFQ